MRAGVVGAAVLLAATASGGIEHTILHGVSVGHVKTWVSPDTVPGLTTEGLKAQAEEALRKAGIVLDSGSEADLFISANAVLEADTCFVTVESRLLEPAKLDRNGFAVTASSWQSGGVVVMKGGECAKPTTDMVRSELADFVEHYRAMNPGKERR